MKREDLEKSLGAFLDGLSRRYPDAPPAAVMVNGSGRGDAIVWQLVRSFLMWDAPRSSVDAAVERLDEVYVDANELRVGLPEEVAAVLGPRFPHARERCLRLRACLREVFERENALVLAHLKDQPKRTARGYLDSLPGIPPFVAARVALLCLEAHAFPVDGVLCRLLIDAGAAGDGEDPDSAAGRLERFVRAGDAAACYARLERAALEGADLAVATRRPAKPSGPKRAGKSR